MAIRFRFGPDSRKSPSKHCMMIHRFLFPILGLLALLAPARAATPSHPNIISIFADVLGPPKVSCYGPDHFKPPHLDHLAGKATRYTPVDTAPLSGPPRALVMPAR